MNNDDQLLSSYLLAIRRRAPYVVAVLLGFLAAGVAYSYIQTPLYKASAEVLITRSQVENQLNLTTGARDSDRDLNNEVKFANSDRVAEAAANALGEAPSVSIRSDDDADTIVIVATAESAAAAAEGANAYAEAFLQERVSFAGEAYVNATSAIEARLDEIRSERNGLLDTFRGGVAPDQTTQSRINVLDSQETSLLNEIAQFELVTSLNDSGRVQLNREAKVPTAAFHPNWIRNIVGAVLLGLVSGAGVAVLAEALSDKVRSREELLAASGGITVLTGVPSSGGRGKSPSLLGTNASVQFRESFRSLRSSLQLLQEPDSSLVLLVTSPNQGEGKSTIALNLATTFARSGQNVLVIDADLRRPQVHNLVSVHNDGGVSEFLRTGEFNVVREQASGKNLLDVLPAGDADEELFETLSTGGLTVLIDKVRDSYDIVIVDSAPILPVADSLAVAPVVDGVILAVRSRSTTRRAVAHAVELLGRAEAKIVGTVLTMSNDHVNRYGYGGYGKESGN